MNLGVDLQDTNKSKKQINMQCFIFLIFFTIESIVSKFPRHFKISTLCYPLSSLFISMPKIF